MRKDEIVTLILIVVVMILILGSMLFAENYFLNRWVEHFEEMDSFQ